MSEKLTLGQRIRKRRKELGHTQQDLADLAGYKSKTAIAKIEADERGIQRGKLNAFANALMVDVTFLLEDNEEHQDAEQIILISKDGNRQSYILTPKQYMQVKELLDQFLIDSFNDKFDESKPTFEELMFGSENASFEVKMNKLYNLLIMVDWENEEITPQMDKLLTEYCELTNTPRKRIFDDAKRIKKERLKQGLPYPF